MLSSLALYAASFVIMLLAPAGAAAVPMLVVSVALEAIALSVMNPITGSLMFINANPEERARVCGLMHATISLIVAVFPSLIGFLANISIRIPFVIAIGLFAFAAVLTVLISRLPAPGTEE